MTRLQDSIRVYVELARLSNLPTCLSNVLVGCSIGVAGGSPALLDFKTVAIVTISIALLYIGGMVLNDVVDLPHDRRERPGRPIPSGRISRTQSLYFSLVCIVSGVLLISITSLFALLSAIALKGCIVAYDLLHKKYALSSILMGLCRAGVYITAAFAVTSSPDWTIATPITTAMGFYIIVITVIARRETQSIISTHRWWSLSLPFVLISPVLIVHSEMWTWIILAAVVMITWIFISANNLFRSPPRIGSAIMGWLAGICLVDAFYLTLLDQPVLALIAGVCFLLTVLAHRVIPGT